MLVPSTDMIDLSKYSPSTIVLSGRPKGEKIRADLRLDAADALPAETIEVSVPQEVVSMNSSFFLGLFGPSVRKLGATQFQQKYIFKAREAVLNDVTRGIRDALESSNPLAA
jgi:hypothetical protein